MNWLQFIIAWQSVVLVLGGLGCAMHVEVTTKPGAVFVSAVARAIITLALYTNGASMGWLIVLTALSVGNIADEMNHLWETRKVGLSDFLWALVMTGGTIALAASAL